MRISDWSSDVCSSDLVEGQVPEDGEVFRSVVGAVAGGVLVEGHVEHPMEAVLDGPVGADGAGEAFRGEAGGGKIVAGGGATAVAHGLDAGEGGDQRAFCRPSARAPKSSQPPMTFACPQPGIATPQ